MPAHTPPVRIAFAGLRHGHVHWWFRRPSRNDVAVVGVSEPDAAIADLFVAEKKLDPALIHRDLDTMLDTVQPEAVTAFGTTAEHLRVVRACAPRGMHVMVEKPLALDHAQGAEMARLGRSVALT